MGSRFGGRAPSHCLFKHSWLNLPVATQIGGSFLGGSTKSFEWFTTP